MLRHLNHLVLCLLPDPGLGGHCIPIDPCYYGNERKRNDNKTYKLAGKINASIPMNIINKLCKEFEQRKSH